MYDRPSKGEGAVQGVLCNALRVCARVYVACIFIIYA